MTSRRQRLLGLDPGLARLGWAVVETDRGKQRLMAAGCLTTPARWTTADRLTTLAGGLEKLLRRYHPAIALVEQVFFSKNVSTALLTSQVRGVVLMIAARSGLVIREFTPTAVKLAVTGDGRADKRQIAKMVRLLLGQRRLPAGDDATDAIAIALCGAGSLQLIS